MNAQTVNANTDSVDDQVESLQFVSFQLAGEEYGVPITQVQEIIRYESLTRVPQSSRFVRGVLNLRGRVMPVIDLRRKFNLPGIDTDRSTRIIVVDVEGSSVGMVVDRVSQVIDVDPREVEPAPELGARVNTDYIRGMGKMEDRLVILLDIDRVLTASEMAEVSEAVGDTE